MLPQIFEPMRNDSSREGANPRKKTVFWGKTSGYASRGERNRENNRQVTLIFADPL